MAIEEGPASDGMPENPPAERPYSEAITDAHRKFLAERGIEV